MQPFTMHVQPCTCSRPSSSNGNHHLLVMHCYALLSQDLILALRQGLSC